VNRLILQGCGPVRPDNAKGTNRSHNPKVAGSNPAPATKNLRQCLGFFVFSELALISYIKIDIVCRMTVVRRIRDIVGMTQSELAEIGRTSQPAIAAYESGAKLPSLRTLQRLSAAAGLDLQMMLSPALTHEDRRSIALHRRIGERLLQEPEPTIAKARANLEHMAKLHPHARGLLGQWARLLDEPVDVIVATLSDPDPRYRELRQVTPFAGVLDRRERADVYRRFRLEDTNR